MYHEVCGDLLTVGVLTKGQLHHVHANTLLGVFDQQVSDILFSLQQTFVFLGPKQRDYAAVQAMVSVLGSHRNPRDGDFISLATVFCYE